MTKRYALDQKLTEDLTILRLILVHWIINPTPALNHDLSDDGRLRFNRSLTTHLETRVFVRRLRSRLDRQKRRRTWALVVVSWLTFSTRSWLSNRSSSDRMVWDFRSISLLISMFFLLVRELLINREEIMRFWRHIMSHCDSPAF